MADLVPIPRALLDRLAAVVDISAVLRRANIPRSRFGAARPQATTAEFFAFWQAVEQCGADAEVGLRIGAEILSEYNDVATLVALHSASLGDGLEKFARYKRLVCPEKVWMDIGDGEVRLRFGWPLTEQAPPILVTDLLFAFIVSLVQRGTTRPIQPRRIDLTRRRLNETMLRRHFRCELRFDAPHDVLVFDEATLALPMVNRDAQLFSVLLPGLELAVAQDDQERTLVDDARSAIGEAMFGGRPSIAGLARSLGMGPRTLQRRLGELGTSYQVLLADVRRQSARQLLTNTDYAISEIAFLLGFEEVNSFMRAFHAWEGSTPAKWRATAARSRRQQAGLNHGKAVRISAKNNAS